MVASFAPIHVTVPARWPPCLANAPSLSSAPRSRASCARCRPGKSSSVRNSAAYASADGGATASCAQATRTNASGTHRMNERYCRSAALRARRAAMRAYLDWNATTPPLPEVVDAMRDAALNAWGNPASVHATGRAARAVVEEARAAVAELTGTDPRDVTFTASGTEANNLA